MSQQSDPTPLADPSPTQPVVDPLSGRISRDLPCIACEYNLRTLRFNGSCPECGRAVRDSLRELLAGPSERDWLASLKTGFAVLTWGAAASWVALVLTFVITGFSRVPEPLFTAVFISGSLGVIMLAAGAFLVMGAKPPILIYRQPWWPGAVFSLGLVATVILVIVMSKAPDIIRRYPLLVLLLAPLLCSAPIAFGARCGWLAGRLHRDDLQRGTTTAVWIIAAWMVTGTAALLAFVAAGVWGVKRAVVLQPPLMLLVMILLLCALAMWTRLFVKFRKTITDEIQRFS